MSRQITVKKQDGSEEMFDEGKLRDSLLEAKAPKDVTEEIIDKITEEIEHETTTSAIYKRAFNLLKEKRKGFAARYSLRQSLADLGPTGYPFEQFVARLFAAEGFETEMNVNINGVCTRHEVDVVATNKDRLVFVEAKFHNNRSIKSTVQTPLYVRARFDDLAENDYGKFKTENREIEHWLVTNTKFSNQAKKYGECAGLEMIGWGHPAEGNLEELIERSELQPVTALTTLSGSNKRELTKQNIVLCKSLRKEQEKLAELGFSEEKIAEVLDEVNHLCHS